MIYIASDHRGYELKENIKKWLASKGYMYEDMGADTLDLNDDYPDFVSKAAIEVSKNPDEHRGIVLGYSGQGEAIVANKFKGIRAVVFYGMSQNTLKEDNGKSRDIIYLSREDDDANVLSIGAGFVDDSTAQAVVKQWLETPFSGEERHKRRIEKIEKYTIDQNILIHKQ